MVLSTSDKDVNFAKTLIEVDMLFASEQVYFLNYIVYTKRPSDAFSLVI